MGMGTLRLRVAALFLCCLGARGNVESRPEVEVNGQCVLSLKVLQVISTSKQDFFFFFETK